MQLLVSRNREVDLAPMKDESVLFHPGTNKFCLLNVTAAFLWDQLDEPRTISMLANRLCEHFDGVSVPDVTRDVERIVTDLLTLECLESSKN